MKLDVIKLDSDKAGSVDLDDAIFGIEEIRADILQRAVKWQLSRRQAGTLSLAPGQASMGNPKSGLMKPLKF